MTVALIDNGSLEPAAHRNLRALAAGLAERAGVPVHAVSWKHSDRIEPAALVEASAKAIRTHVPLQSDGRAWTLAAWLRTQFAAGERAFLIVPFFISSQGAIGSALRKDIETLRQELGYFTFGFTASLAADGTLVQIAAARVREVIAAQRLSRPAVIVVDHGGPSLASAQLRDGIAAQVARELGAEIGPLAAASLEGAEYPHNQPLLADQLTAPGFNRGNVVIAPLFLAPGRHAGPHGDLARIARTAEHRSPALPLHCHFAELVGTHPLVCRALAAMLRGARLNVSPHSVSTSRSMSDAAPPLARIFHPLPAVHAGSSSPISRLRRALGGNAG